MFSHTAKAIGMIPLIAQVVAKIEQVAKATALVPRLAKAIAMFRVLERAITMLPRFASAIAMNLQVTKDNCDASACCRSNCNDVVTHKSDCDILRA